MADSLWIIGVAMTKFMRYKDKDLIDLGSEAALAALGDAGLTIFDADILAAGCLYDTNGIGQRIQKQIGQTGIPVYNVTNACATGATAFRVAAMAIKAGEASIGLAVGLEQMGKLGLLGAQPGKKDKPVRACRAVRRGRARGGDPGHQPDAGHVRSVRHGVCLRA